MNQRVPLIRLSWVVAICLALAFSTVAMAQVSTSRLEGYVRDPAGLVIPGVPVTVTNEDDNVISETLSNETGFYVFAQLRPGVYDLSAELAGFKRFLLTGIILELGDTKHENVDLETGEISETVQVSAQVESVDVVSTSVGNVVNEQQIENLPLVSRNTMNLFYMQAGANQFAGGGRVDGLRYNQNNVTIEGVGNQDPMLTGGATQSLAPVPIEAVGEYRVVTSSAAAEFGRGAGAQVQLIYRSGTNEFHGSGFWFHRNKALNTASFFANKQGLEKETFIRHQYGGSGGGPIIKDRLFFHFTYEGTRQKQDDIRNATVFTNEFKTTGMYRYESTDTGEIKSFDVATVDSTRLGKDSSGIFDSKAAAFPLPNNFDIGDGLNTGGHRFLTLNPYYNWQTVLKVDYVINSQHRLGASYADRRLNNDASKLLNGQVDGTNSEKYPAGILSINSSFTPTILNEFRVGGTKRDWKYGNPDPYRWELTGMVIPQALGGPGRDHPHSIFLPQAGPSATITFADNMTWVRGSHSFRGGIDIRINRNNTGFGGDRYIPVISTSRSANPPDLSSITDIGSSDRVRAEQATNDYTGSIGDIRQDYHANVLDAFSPYETKFRGWRSKEYSFFFQDTWKVKPNLTLNLGFRWEIMPAHYERTGVYAYPVGGADGLLGLSTGQETKLEIAPNQGKDAYKTDWNNFAPNVGFNWDPTGSGIWSISANFRTSYDRNPLVNTLFVDYSQEGMSTYRTIFGTAGQRLTDLPGMYNSSTGYFAPGDPLGPKPVNVQGLVSAYDPNLYVSGANNWSLRIQRELMRNTVLTVSYVGNKGSGMNRGVNLNQINIRGNGFLDGFQAAERNYAASGDPIVGENTGVFGSLYNVMSSSDQGSVRSYLGRGEAASAANFIGRSRASRGYVEAAGFAPYFFYANPQFYTSWLQGNNSNSTWHGLKFEVSKRFSDGLQFEFNYTFSKGLTDYSGSQSNRNAYRDNYDRGLEKTFANIDSRHVINANGIWEVPFGSGRRWLNALHPVLDGVLGGWQINGILALSSGRPFTIDSGRRMLTYQDTSTADCSGCDPMMTSMVNKGDTITALSETQKAMFTQPKSGSAGQTAQTYFRNSRKWVVDSSVFKEFPLRFIPGEQGKLQFRFEFFNTFNHTNFDTMQDTITSSTFGVISSADDPRIIQVALKLYF